MTSRSIGIRFAIAVASLLPASSVRAECISPGEWWLRDKLVEVVFSGTAIEVTRTAEAGYRATFDVERVWKGHVPRHFTVYVWELSPERDRIDAGRRYLVGATRLIDARARQGLGFAGTDSVAFTEVNCGAPDYKEAERTGMIRDLGAGQPPDQPPADFAFKFDFKPCLTNSLDTYRNIYTRELGLGEPPISIPLTLTTEQMADVHAALDSIRFFDYPTTCLGPRPAATGEARTVFPYTTYRLQVRSSGVVHAVSWDDRSSPHSEEASRLLKVFELINGFVNDHPDVKRLPLSRAGCE